jgi:ATP-dependent protease ClpP protease subunit
MDTVHTTYVNFYAPIAPESVGLLFNVIQQKLQQGTGRFVLLISSPGGNVAAGLSAYNFLKGIDAEVETHNFGSVDSIAIAVFCAGKRRYCVKNARFFMHGIGFDVPQGTRFEARQLDEKQKSLKIDRENVATVIAENCKRTAKEIDSDMMEVKELNASDAISYGLVHEIKDELYPHGADVVNISIWPK